MSIYKIYPSKSNTIASGIYALYNSGQNAVTDLWYGGGKSSELYKRNSISRFIVKFDLTDLQSKLNSKEINQDLVVSYKLKLKNAIPKDRILENEYEFDRLYKKISASFDLICFPINKDWDEGRGYDLMKEVYIVKQKGNLQISGYSNWNSATSSSDWDESGIFTNPTASTAVTTYVSQHFDIGNEDIDMNVTDIVNSWLSGVTTNYGFAIAYRRDFELISGDTQYIASFFTEKTNSAFKPYLEVNYNQVIKDDRHQVTNNRTSRLFLYTFSGNSAVNYFSAGTVTIKKGNTEIYTGLTPTHLEKGVYYIDVWMSAATRGEKYTDVWKDITFVAGKDKQDFTQYFQIKDNYYLNTPSINEYSLTTSGIENNSILSNEEIIKVFCDLRINYSTKAPSTAYDLQYRMIMNNQMEVIPWTSVNQTILNGCQSNYFILETNWLLHNQTYQVQFKIDEMGSSRILAETIDFRVLRSF